MSMRSQVKKLTPPSIIAFGRGCERRLVRVIKAVVPPRLPRNPGGKIYLNLGCGYDTHPAFVNVDALPAWHIHYVRPVDDLKPFRDGSVDLVYVSHCLEHFSHRRVNEVLTEWWRVLKPGGILRLGVPDFDQLLAVYEANNRDIESIQGVLMGGQTYPLNSHYTTFTERSLTDRLRTVGFSQVRRWERGTDELTSLPDCTALTVPAGDRVIPLSLNLEAVK